MNNEKIKEVYFNTFIFKGKTYPLNTSVKIKSDVYILTHKLGALCDRPLVQVVKSYIDCNGKHRWTYAIWSRSGNVYPYTTIKSPDEMVESIISTPNKITSYKPDVEYYKDSEVKGVGIGWFIYIAIMIFGSIFKDAIVVWIFATIYFFWWRKQKLKKPEKFFYGVNAYEKVREWNAER